MTKFTLLAAIFLAGCCETKYITKPLPIPERPILPSVQETELACISDGTYRKIVERERLRREYAETCEAIVRSTHSE